jgi:hypothetical protein
MNDRTLDYYRPDIWVIGDDIATAIDPLVSVPMLQEMVIPFQAADAKLFVDVGDYITIHCCGRCEDPDDDWLAFGDFDDPDTLDKMRWVTEEYDSYGRGFYMQAVSGKEPCRDGGWRGGGGAAEVSWCLLNIGYCRGA